MSFQLNLLPSLNFLSLLFLLFVVLTKIHPTSTTSDIVRSCSIPFRCGKITASYPFSGGEREYACGHPSLNLNCENDTATLVIGGSKHRVLNVNQKEQLLRISRQVYFDGLCPQRNFTIDPTLFDYATGYDMLTLTSGCPTLSGNSICYIDGLNYTNGFLQTGSPDCNFSVIVLVSETLLSAAKSSLAGLREALDAGFELKWKLNSCKNCSSCRYNVLSNEGICHCPGNSTACSISPASPKPNGSSSNKARKIYIGIAASVLGTIVIPAIVLSVAVGRVWKKKTEHDQDAEAAFIRNYGSLAPKRFN